MMIHGSTVVPGRTKRTPHQWTRIALILTMTLLATTVSLAAQAGAVTLVTLHGTITDAIGRPLQGVAVTDPANGGSAYTDAAGAYSYGESRVGTYTLIASRAALNTATTTVSPTAALSPVNF